MTSRRELWFTVLCLAAMAIPLGLLVLLFGQVLFDSLPRLSWDFLTSYPSRRAENAGVLPGLVGSALLCLGTAAIALPVGVGAAIFLEEYGGNRRLARVIELNVANLAGVPSILYGILGLAVFVRALELGRSVISGAATLALLVLPIVIVSSREALRAVPHGLREASLALGATQWQTIRRVVLPSAAPGIFTGAILAVSRALGETAPLVVIGAVAYVTYLPDSPRAAFTALPIQIFNWISRPQASFAHNAAAGIVVLLVLLLLLNSAVIILRDRAQRRASR